MMILNSQDPALLGLVLYGIDVAVIIRKCAKAALQAWKYGCCKYDGSYRTNAGKYGTSGEDEKYGLLHYGYAGMVDGVWLI